MVLPEVIRRLVPIAAIGHLIALGRVGVWAADCLLFQGGDDQFLIEGIVFAQSHVPHILIGLDACSFAIGAIHDAQVVGTSGHTVPGLSCLLKVADILITDLEIVTYPGQTTIIASAASTRTIDKTIGIGLVIGAIENQVVP